MWKVLTNTAVPPLKLKTKQQCRDFDHLISVEITARASPTCDRQLLYWQKSQNEENSEETFNLNISHGQAWSCSKTIQSLTRLAAKLLETIRTRDHLDVSAIIIKHKNYSNETKDGLCVVDRFRPVSQRQDELVSNCL